jgi:hypothetical protein
MRAKPPPSTGIAIGSPFPFAVTQSQSEFRLRHMSSAVALATFVSGRVVSAAPGLCGYPQPGEVPEPGRFDHGP